MPEIESNDEINSTTKGINERKRSKIFILFNQILHPGPDSDEVINDQQKSEPKFKHSKSKSLSNPSKVSFKSEASLPSKTQLNTPKPQIKMTQKILEFLHLKDREGEDLDVEISENELEMLRETVPLIHDRHDLSFKLKYHFIGSKIIGKGASGIVRLAAGNMEEDSKQRFAVKELRKRKKQETCTDYLKKLIREFRIAMLMHHENVVNTIDFVMIGDKWYEVMEYCSGGDLFAAIQKGKMGQEEIDCCFKQMIYGVQYLHEMGVSHRDLKPENLLIDSNGRVKITDFGVSEVFCDLEWYLGDIPSLKEKKTTTNSASENNLEEGGEEVVVMKPVHKLKGLCGSCPYIAPEEFSGQEYDGRLVDIWSIGIIYYAMVFHCVPWEMAHPKNPNYKQFLKEGFDNFEPFTRLPAKPRALLKRILEPDPLKRVTIEEIMKDEWFTNIRLCTEQETLMRKMRRDSFSYKSDFDHDDHLGHNH
jgi:serine/threonine protein kinase